jgi:hypothetical protein
MLPEWFGKPDTIYKTVLWLLSPVYVWAAKKSWRKVKELNDLTSERAARIRLASLRGAVDNPPTLLSSVAYLVCFLPLPIALVATVGTIYFVPFRPAPRVSVDPQVVATVVYTVLFVVCLINYVLFAVLTLYGIQVAYRLRHGEALYAENYKKSIQKQIDRLMGKFPGLATNREPRAG